MDIQFYQKMFQPPQLFPSMNPFTINYQQQQQLLFQQCFQQQSMAQLINPLFFLSANQNFMNGHHQEQHQQQRYRRSARRQNALQLAPTFNTATSLSYFNTTTAAAPWMPTYSSGSSSCDGGSIKEAATGARDIFFKTLSFSLKNAHQHFINNGKTGANWRNPFLYKTTLCHNYTKRTFCRFGVNCWFAHGHHELRCIPDSKELPDPVFITRYLSFLGLPSQLLEQMIQTAYSAASNCSSSPSSSNATSPCSSSTSCFFASSSTSQRSNDHHLSFFPSPLSHSPIKAIAASTPNSTAVFHPKSDEDKFYSSLTSNLDTSGWDGIEFANNKDIVDVKNENDGNGKPLNDLYDHVYHLFGAIGNPW